MEVIIKDEIQIPIGTHEGKRIVLAADHRGYQLKNALRDHLHQQSYHIEDLGVYTPERADYPPLSQALGRFVGNSFYTVGIGVCGSGIGIVIPASKVKGVYAARCLSLNDAISSRQHNNTNMLGLSADQTEEDLAKMIVDAWLTTPFYANPAQDEAYLQRFVQTVRIERES